MKHISKFTKFNEKLEFRKPTKVNRSGYSKKLSIHGKSPFDEKELKFFENFTLMNQNCETRLDISDFDITCSLGGKDILIKITKLEDEWYLIKCINYSHNHYICDEWEEVLGYLSNNYNFKI